VTRAFYWRFTASPEELFPLLCATREADWIEGTTHELVYTESGYAEKDYIFKSDYFGLGEEVWARFEHVENESLAYYRFSPNVLVKFEIRLHDNLDGTVNTRWRVTYTGLNNAGNEIVDAVPPVLELEGIMRSLQHYLDTGEMRTNG
jgi:hypothetical protein